MSSFFLKIVNMSIAASWLILAVVLLRVVLKKAPKWINVLLWGIVAFRLICPFSFESALSLIPSAETISPEIMMDWTPEISTGVSSIDKVVNPIITDTFAPEPIASANPLQLLIPALAIVWADGHHSHARLCCRQLFPLAKESRCIPFCAGQHLDL